MFFSSCNKDVQDLTIQGTVYDADTKEPINGVDVKVICWKYGNSPDESYSEKETKVVKTDSEGKYKVNFDKGARIDVEVTLEGYLEGHVPLKIIYQKKNTINVALEEK